MVSWWPANGNANDIKGTNHGTLENGTTFDFGQVNQAFNLDGIDDSVLLPTINVGSAFTVEFWIYPRAASGDYQHLVSNSYISANYGALYFLDDHLEYWQGRRLRVDTTQGSIPLNEWTHVALSYGDSVDRLYVNGRLAGISENHAETFNNQMRIGYNVGSPESSHFRGLLDEVTLFGRALVIDEVESLYLGGSAGKCQGLTAAGGTLINESCPPANSAIDPGERVTVHFKLMNNGAATTSNLVATLQSGGGVVAPSNSQAYGAITPGGITGRDFSFTADPALTPGQTITATLQLQDGATSLGTVSFSFSAGPSPCGGVRLVITSTPLQRSFGTVTTTITVQNIGTLPADNVMLTTAILGSASGEITLPNLTTINMGASASTQITFTTAATGASQLKIGGTYGPGMAGSGSFNSTRRTTIP